MQEPRKHAVRQAIAYHARVLRTRIAHFLEQRVWQAFRGLKMTSEAVYGWLVIAPAHTAAHHCDVWQKKEAACGRDLHVWSHLTCTVFIFGRDAETLLVVGKQLAGRQKDSCRFPFATAPFAKVIGISTNVH